MTDGRNPALLAEQRLAVPREKAAQLGGLTLRQVDYWASTGLIEPGIDVRVSPGRRVRLYGFVDLLALLVAAELKKRGVTLQHIRVVVHRLQARGYEQPLTQLRWATVGRRVYFQHDDGSWEGDLRPDQRIIEQVLHLEPLRQRIIEGTRRDEALIGQIEHRRGARGGKAVVAGTRVPVDTIRRYLAAGRTVDDIIRAFPVLTSADVETARHTVVA